MKTSHRTLLCFGLAAAMASPLASAQDDRDAAAHSAATQRTVWADLDADGDARLSADEAAVDAALSGRFTVVDADGDGFVSADEFRADAHADHVVDASATGAEHAAAHSAVAVRATWADLDADGDGRISATEADADDGFASGFAALDADGDGYVSEAEFRADAKAGRKPLD